MGITSWLKSHLWIVLPIVLVCGGISYWATAMQPPRVASVHKPIAVTHYPIPTIPHKTVPTIRKPIITKPTVVRHSATKSVTTTTEAVQPTSPHEVVETPPPTTTPPLRTPPSSTIFPSPPTMQICQAQPQSCPKSAFPAAVGWPQTYQEDVIPLNNAIAAFTTASTNWCSLNPPYITYASGEYYDSAAPDGSSRLSAFQSVVAPVQNLQHLPLPYSLLDHLSQSAKIASQLYVLMGTPMTWLDSETSTECNQWRASWNAEVGVWDQQLPQLQSLWGYSGQ